MKYIHYDDETQTIAQKELIEKIKDYQFDSLVYRYIRVREQMAEYESIINKEKTKVSCYKVAKRDILKFIEILNEVMEKHN